MWTFLGGGAIGVFIGFQIGRHGLVGAIDRYLAMRDKKKADTNNERDRTTPD